MGKTVKLTTKTFIEKAIAKHSGKFGYDHVDYVNSKTKISILCGNCGKYFMQAPNKHLSGQGCPKAPCGGQGKYTTEEYIEAAVKQHGNKYGYERVVYKSAKDKIEISCKTCDEYFSQPAGRHLRHGCLKCSERENGMKRRIGIDEFKMRAIAVHGSERYEYNKVKYKTMHDKVKIFCNVCKKYFSQTADSHLNGNGCPCNRGERLTNETFKEKASLVHGDKYSYHDVQIINNKKKINILCNNCKNTFRQAPHEHISGHGCPKSSCGGKQKLTHREFVDKARKKHGAKYKYIDQYITSQTKIRIQCNDCGTVNTIAPNTHLTTIRGGCPFCNGGSQSNTEDFIRKAMISHDVGKYDYSKFIYINAKTKGIIKCNIHNEYFACAPYNHLSGFKDGVLIRKGGGCPICGREIVNLASTKSFGVFLSQAREIHGNAYEYDEISYGGVKNKMNIYCHEHGLFKQDPDSHINSAHGCPVCKSSNGEKLVRSALIDAGAYFKGQQGFEACKNIRKLPFDFAMTNSLNNLKGLIEFHGQQHYEPIEYYGGEEVFFETNRNDQIKADFCELNKIPFLVISYKDMKAVPKIVKKFLKQIKNKTPIIEFCESTQINIFQV